MQAKFLRVLEGHAFERVGGHTPIRADVRLVAATNQPLEQQVRIGPERFCFAEGESIRTEYSYKYSPKDLRALAVAAGFEVRQVWTDDRRYFSVLYLTVP